MISFQSESSGDREIAPLLKANKLCLPEGQDRACRQSAATAQTGEKVGGKKKKAKNLPALVSKH